MNRIFDKFRFPGVTLFICLLPFFLSTDITNAESLEVNVDNIGKGLSSQILLTEQEQAWLDQKHTVRVRVGTAPPYHMSTPEPHGISVDYMKMIGKRFDINISYVKSLAWEVALDDLARERKNVDLLLSMERTPEREKQFALTQNYLFAPRVIINRIGTDFVSRVDDLNGKSVAVEKGYVTKDKINAEYPKIKTIECENTEDALESVANGRAEAFIGNLAIATYIIQNSGFSNLKVAAPTAFGDNNQAMAVRKDWPELASIINKALTAMSDVEKNNLNSRWFSIKYDYDKLTKKILIWIAVTLVTLLLIIAFTLVWNKRLRREIENRIKAEKKLRDNESFIRTVLENLPVGIAVKSGEAEESIRYMNDKFSQIYRTTGLEVAASKDLFISVLEPPSIKKKIIERLLGDHDSKISESVSFVDVPIIRKGDKATFISSTTTYLPKENIIISTVWDVTERKRIREERERLLAAIEQVGEVIIITDADGDILFANPAFEKTTGYTFQEVSHLTPRILKSGEHDEAFYRDLWHTISSGKTWTGHLINKHKDGKLYTEDATISPVFNAEGRIINYVAVKRDITEKIKLEAQFIQAQKMESVGRLTGGVAHDFNNILSVILGYTELGMDMLDPSQQIHTYLKTIRESAKRATDIVRQLLAFSRQQAILPKVLDLNKTVADMLHLLRRLIGEAIDLAWVPFPDLPPIKIDPTQIDQILANLCVNARDAIKGIGNITIETNVVTLDKQHFAGHPEIVSGDYVVLSVSDDGEGIDKEILDKIFEPFFTTKAVGEGTGLGLATVYGIVKQNNGVITVDSEPGQGTTFNIYLQSYIGDKIEEKKREVEGIWASKGETILLVEDEKVVLKLAGTILEGLGYRVLAAESPNEALQMATKHIGKIDLVLTDVVMPEMNGRELSDRLTALRPEIKRLYMSGYTADIIGPHGILNEGVNFIQKPFAKRDLAAKVNAVLSS